MSKVVLNDITGSYGSVAALNALFDLISTGFDNTLSRDGTSPNTMSADIDLNSNDLLNVNSILAQYFKDSSGNLISLADINTLGAIVADITTVAGISANVTTVAGISANVTTVAGISGSVTTVAGVSADVTTLAPFTDEITNISDAIDNGDLFTGVYQGAYGADPTLRQDATPLQVGDLYFNTVLEQLKVYTGTTWRSGVAGDITIQNFSGDGATTTFPLASAVTSEDNLQVYINGIYQQKNTFQIPPGFQNLAFTEAPPLGTDNIEVVAIETLALGEGAASLTTYQPDGTGAVQTTVQEKLRESVSVLDFGADPTGAVDATVAIQAAINAAKRVYFPAGTYLVSGAIVIGPSNIPHLYGDGVKTIIHSTYGGDLFHIGATPGSTAEGLYTGGSISDMFIQLYNTTGIGIRLYQTSMTELRNLQVYSYAARPNTQVGIELDGGNLSGYYNQLTNINVQGCNVGYKHTSTQASGFLTSNTFINCSALCYLDNGDSIGHAFNGANGLDSIFVGGNLEACKQGIRFGLGAIDYTADMTQGTNWHGQRFEANTVDIDWGNYSFRNTFFGCTNMGVITDDGTSLDNIVIGGGAVRNDSTVYGAWYDVPYSAGNFTGFTTMTWTVAGADQIAYTYTVLNKTMTISFLLTDTLIAGTPTTALYIALPAGYTVGSRRQIFDGLGIYHNSAWGSTGTVDCVAGASQMVVYHDAGGSVYTAGRFDIRGTITLNIA